MKNDDSRSTDRKTISASLKNLCRIELPHCDYIDIALNSVDIEESIMEADTGVQFAKMRMRHMAACYLSSDKFGPIPPSLRKFAARELEKLSKGSPDPIKPNGGRPPRTYRKKLVIAHWIYKTLKQQGMSQNAACAALAEFLSKNNGTPNKSYGGEAISPEALRKIYREVLPDIEELYEEVRKTRATTVPIRCVD